MIDPRLLLDNYEETLRRLRRRGVSEDLVSSARELAQRRLAAVQEVDGLREQHNARSARVGLLMRQGSKEEANQLRAQLSQGKQNLEEAEEQLRTVEAVLNETMAQIPNIPDDAVPYGQSEADNRVVRTWGWDPQAYEGKTWRPHWEIAEEMGVMDAEAGARLSGNMFTVLRGEGARLLRSLVNFGLDLHRSKYTEMVVPHLVRTETISRTGHLTKFDTQAYRLRDDDLWLLPTGEVALMGLGQDQIFAEAELPDRKMTYTVCWRREAGAAGRDTRGLQRLHEFHKVELVVLCTPESSQDQLNELLGDCEKTLQTLGLPYRVLELCTADLTFSSSRVYDLEVYAPGVDKWLEVCSVSLITDYQARRGAIRYRPESGGTALVHSLNGSGLATPRILSALIELGQQPDGTVKLPPALVPYFGSDTMGRPED